MFAKHPATYPPASIVFATHTLLAQACLSGPSCSKLTMSLVNDSLKFTLSNTQKC